MKREEYDGNKDRNIENGCLKSGFCIIKAK